MSRKRKYKIGEELYDLKTFEFLGVISKEYEYYGQTHYAFESSANCFGNTSRLRAIFGYTVGNRRECIKALRTRLKHLRTTKPITRASLHRTQAEMIAEFMNDTLEMLKERHESKV